MSSTATNDAGRSAWMAGWRPLTRRRELLLFACVPLLALLLRGIYLLEIRDAPLFTLLVGDAASYDRWGRAIAGGDWLSRSVTGDSSFYQAPLYPYFLGLLYAIFGHSLLAVRLVQVALGAAACWLLARAGRHLFGVAAGLIAGALFALYPPAIFFDALIQKSVLDGFFVALLLYLLARQADEPRPWRWPLLGAALGFLVLARENALLLVIVVLAWAAVRAGRGHPRSGTPSPETGRVPVPSSAAAGGGGATGGGEGADVAGAESVFAGQSRPSPQPSPSEGRWGRAIAALLILVGLGAVLLPVALRNKAVGGEFLVTTSQFGPNFYIGNNPRATGTYVPLRPGRGDPLYERLDAQELAEAALGRRLSPREVSDYWAQRAFDYIERQKARWLRLIGRKFLMLLHRVEIGDTEDLYTYSDWSRLLRTLMRVLHWGVVLPLAALGIALSMPQWRRTWLFYKLILAYGATVVLFYVVARYRYPLAPMAILFAGAGIVLAVEAARRRRWAHLGAAAAAAVGVAILSNILPGPSVDDSRAVTLSNIGYGLAEQHGRRTEAIAYLRRAVELRRTYAPARYNLGAALVNADCRREALHHLAEAARLQPDFAEAHYQLGATLLALDDPARAVAPLARAAQLRPDDPLVHQKLAVALARQDRVAEALPHFAQAARLDPSSHEAAYNLGRALLQLGRPRDAEAPLARALALQPDAMTALLLADAQAGAGRPQDAHGTAEHALRLAERTGDAPLAAAIRERLSQTEPPPW